MDQNFPRLSYESLLALAPAGAHAAILAEQIVDQSDSMSDYYGSRRVRTVVIGWRMTQRESFKALRKAAAGFEHTKHLGPGCDSYKVLVVLDNDAVTQSVGYWKGSYSHWHTEEGHGREFFTLAEAEAFIAAAGKPEPITIDGTHTTFSWTIKHDSYEHRENWSMGAGNYLKAGGRHWNGWQVRSQTLREEWSKTVLNNIEVSLLAAAKLPTVLEQAEAFGREAAARGCNASPYRHPVAKELLRGASTEQHNEIEAAFKRGFQAVLYGAGEVRS